MQFPHSSNHDSASDDSGSPRIEPTIGESKPSPWDVKPEAAPAFELVEDPGEPWEGGKAPEDEADDINAALADAGRTEPTFDAFDRPEEGPQEPPFEAQSEAADIPGLTATHDKSLESESLTIPTAESASIDAPSLSEEPATQEADPAAGAVAGAAAATVAATAEKPQAAPTADEKKMPGFFAFMKKGAEEARAKRPEEENEAPSEEQLVAREKTRNRLIGAAAILMAVVVSSSFILDNEELVKGEANISTAIPPVPEKSAMQVEKPAASNVVSPKTEAVKPAPVTAAKKAEPKADKKVTEKKPVAKPVSKPAEPVKKAAPKGYFIQIVVTSSKEKADRMVHDLKRLKLPAYSEQIKGKKGPLWRVRIGHFKTEKEAKNTVAVLALNGYTGKHYIDKQ